MAKKKRAQLLVIPRFQWRFVIFVGLTTLITSSSIIVLNFILFDDFLTSIHLAPRVFNPFLLQVGLYTGLVSLIITFLASVFAFNYSHKIAGPIFKTKQIIESLRQRKLPRTTRFRQTDHFQDLSDQLSGLIEGIIDHDARVKQQFPDEADQVQYLKN